MKFSPVREERYVGPREELYLPWFGTLEWFALSVYF